MEDDVHTRACALNDTEDHFEKNALVRKKTHTHAHTRNYKSTS